MSDREEDRVIADVRERRADEFVDPIGIVVGPGRQLHPRPRLLLSRGGRFDQFFQHRSAALDVSGIEPFERRGTRPAAEERLVIRRGEIGGELPQLGGGEGRSPSRARAGRLLDERCSFRIRASAHQRHVPRPFLGVEDDLGDARMDRLTSGGRGRPVGRGAHQRMCEVEPLALGDHESRFLGLDETFVDRRGLAARRPQRGERRARHRCDDEHHIPSARREAVDTGAQDVEGITGNLKRQARRRLGITERMDDLEREERIPVRRFMYARDERWRHGPAHPVPKDAGHLVHGERPDVCANRAAIADRARSRSSASGEPCSRRLAARTATG